MTFLDDIEKDADRRNAAEWKVYDYFGYEYLKDYGVSPEASLDGRVVNLVRADGEVCPYFISTSRIYYDRNSSLWMGEITRENLCIVGRPDPVPPLSIKKWIEK